VVATLNQQIELPYQRIEDPVVQRRAIRMLGEIGIDRTSSRLSIKDV
jgi:hypothetical protein